MEQQFALLRSLSRSEAPASEHTRRDRLQRLEHSVATNMPALCAAIDGDFGGRSVHESETFELLPTLAEIRAQRRDLRRHMRPQRGLVPWFMRPSRSALMAQPLGVVGIISPWNFPVYLAIAPLASALAAGNRVMLKLSELAPRTAQLLAQLLTGTFREDELTVSLGDAAVAARFSALPFDHLLFTGSTAVGKIVALAAARNLTPVTLELGGKSPAIITPDADLVHAARKIMHGKLTNAGQICIAPDYVLAPRRDVPMLVDALTAAARAFYPTFEGNPDYTAVISPAHRARYHALLADARAHGARLLPLGVSSPDSRQLPPVLVLSADADARVLTEELFLPILPIVPYDGLDDALHYVNQRERPLALYVFTRSAGERDRVLAGTVSGGVTVNDVFYHCGCGTLPFGGVGASGMGAYHGRAGFDTFSHRKGVFYQARVNAGGLLLPPFTSRSARVRAILKRIL